MPRHLWRGSGGKEAGADGKPPAAHDETIGPDGRGPGALGRGVGVAAPFFQVSDTEQPPHRKSASGGPETTSAGSGSSHNGHASVSTKAVRSLNGCPPSP